LKGYSLVCNIYDKALGQQGGWLQVALLLQKSRMMLYVHQ